MVEVAHDPQAPSVGDDAPAQLAAGVQHRLQLVVRPAAAAPGALVEVLCDQHHRRAVSAFPAAVRDREPLAAGLDGRALVDGVEAQLAQERQQPAVAQARRVEAVELGCDRVPAGRQSGQREGHRGLVVGHGRGVLIGEREARGCGERVGRALLAEVLDQGAGDDAAR